jgi:hypothetical protein
MITPSGTIAAHASVAAPSVHTCGKSTGAVLQPPVSASDNKVYYRDGNTKIKFLTPDGQTGDVTTVPGSATKVSFFSVSPDDTRIAVLVEDLSPSTTIKLSLYVEDLTGHTHHAVIFTNTVPKFKNATTLADGLAQRVARPGGLPTLHVRARRPGPHRMARCQRSYRESRGQDRQPLHPELLAFAGRGGVHRRERAAGQPVRLGGTHNRGGHCSGLGIPDRPFAIRAEHVLDARTRHRRPAAGDSDRRFGDRRGVYGVGPLSVPVDRR